MSEFTNLVEEYVKAKKEFQDKGKVMFGNSVKELFVLHPEIQTIKWNQYTPYFNDGDACTFRVGEVSISNAPSENVTTWGELEDETEDQWLYSGYSGTDNVPDNIKESPLVTEFYKMFNSSVSFDILESLFGDHVVITATKDGISAEEFEHD